MDNKPNPDQLLANMAKKQQGKLRIYFGAVAGVGKTYSMLKAAQQSQADGKRVLIGWVETHNRLETQNQLQDLAILPAHYLDFHGHQLPEFDIDAAIAAAPDLLLLDELAHSNISGSRHPKRWQDIEELLSLGIDVWTTLNVQHLESLNDVIGNITGVLIHETVPDAFFQAADEVVLVDATADELLSRLHEGKIYAQAKIRQATQNFFRKGNLISLREITLRKTAENLEEDIKTYRHQKSIETVWQTDAGALVYISGLAQDESLIRASARLAGQLHCEWHVIFIEAPFEQGKRAQIHKQQAIQDLRFAETLGAKTAMLYGGSNAKLLVAYARKHNLSRMITGQANLWQKWLNAKMKRLAPELDFMQVSHVSAVQHKTKNQAVHPIATHHHDTKGFRPIHAMGMVVMTLSTVALTLLLWPFSLLLENSNIVMLYLLLVVAGSMFFGRSVGLFTTLITVAAFDFAFVEPKISFAVSDVQYLVTFIVMSGVSLLITQLTIYLKYRATQANSREQRAVNLFDFAKTLSGLLEEDEILRQSEKYVSQEFNAQVCFLLPDEHEQLLKPSNSAINLPIAKWAYQHQQTAGFATNTLPEHPILYMPLMAPIRIRGILALAAKEPSSILQPEQRRQLETYARLIALTLERVHFADVAGNVLMEIEAEKMRNTLLAAISHDLKTPLTAMVGEADYLQTYCDKMDETAVRESVASLNHAAKEVQHFVKNILEMASLESGQLQLNQEWQSLVEVISGVVHTLQASAPNAKITIKVPESLPLIYFDAMLISHVLSNLLENSLKYGHEPIVVEVVVRLEAAWIWVDIVDNGVGLPNVSQAQLFEKFYRAQLESNITGSGLGLSIAKMIVDAHQGKIQAANRQDGVQGAVFSFALPLGDAFDFTSHQLLSLAKWENEHECTEEHLNR